MANGCAEGTGLLVEQGDDITVGTTFAKETTGAAISGRAGRGTGLFTHTPTFATQKTTFGARRAVKLQQGFQGRDGMALSTMQDRYCGR